MVSKPPANGSRKARVACEYASAIVRQHARCVNPESGVGGVDPVPREIGHRNRCDPGAGRGGKRQRRHIADDDRRAELLEDAGFSFNPAVERAVERRGLPDGFRLVDCRLSI